MFSRLLSVLTLFIIIMSISACQTRESNSSTANKDGNEETTMDQVTSKMDTIKSTSPDASLSYKVSLGVMPDLNYAGKGMLIGHVNEGRIGHAAGLLKGDVVVELGGQEITDLVSYTRVLSTFQKGDQTKIVVRRDDQLMTMLVEF